MTRKPLLLAIPLLFLMATSAMGLSISEVVGDAVNITIYDGEHGSGSWYGKAEDHEVEVGMQAGQIWDLEAMFWDSISSTLFVVGGFNFKDGQDGNRMHFATGDLFLFGDVDDYVLDFDRLGDDYSNLAIGADSKGTFDVYSDSKGDLETLRVFYPQNDIPSDPYAHNAASNSDDTLKNSGIEYTFRAGVKDGLGIYGDVNPAVGTHYILALSLGEIGIDMNDYQAHLTMYCGNDDLEGRTPPVPEPGTVFLFGAGLIGMAFFGRKKLSGAK